MPRVPYGMAPKGIGHGGPCARSIVYGLSIGICLFVVWLYSGSVPCRCISYKININRGANRGSWSGSKGTFKLAFKEPHGGILAPLVTFKKKAGPGDFAISFKSRSSAGFYRIGGQSVSFGLSESDGESIWFQFPGANFVLHAGNRFQEELSGFAQKKPFYKTNRVSPMLCVNPVNSYFIGGKWSAVKIIGSYPCLEFWINDELSFGFNVDHEISNIEKEICTVASNDDRSARRWKNNDNYCNEVY
jgi:hypothetical protein